jgi:tetratricopeptide (TPR) repeat protein
MGWAAIALRTVLILGVLFWLLDLIQWPPRIKRAQLALWRRLGNRTRTRDALRRLAAQAVLRGDPATAVALRREIIDSGLRSRTPYLPQDLLGLARVLVRYGRFAEAAEWFAELDRLTADNHRLKPTTLVSMAYDMSSLGRFEEAESALQRASSLEVGWDQWLQRRQLRSRTVRWDLAMGHGYVATASGRFPDAQRWYESALALSVTLTQAKRLASLHNLASTSLELGDLENAERRVAEVNQLAGSEPWPGRDHFVHLTGDLRLAQGRLKEARDALEGVLVLRGADAGTLCSLAAIAYREGHLDEANAHLAQIRTDPLDVPARRRLAETLERLANVDEAAGRSAEAEERRRRALALRQKPPQPAPLPDDSLLRLLRSTFARERFGAPGTIQALWLGLYLAGFVWLGFSIVLPLDLPFSITAMQAGALILLILGWPAFSRWVVAPKPREASSP